MKESSNFQLLKEHIIPLSVSKNWMEASSEWVVFDFRLYEDFDHCPCGQPIKEQCHIRNRRNGNETFVGNVCVNRFEGIETGNLFVGLKRIKADVSAAPNVDLIEHARAMGYLHGDKEYQFLISTCRKRNLSEAQIAWRQKINRRILNRVVVNRRGLSVQE